MRPLKEDDRMFARNLFSRNILAACTLTLVGACTSDGSDGGNASACVPGTPAGPAGLSLRQQADRQGVLLGSGAINPDYLDDPQFAQVLAEQFNSLSPENELKWSFVQPAQGVFDFTKLDRLVDFAKQHD